MTALRILMRGIGLVSGLLLLLGGGAGWFHAAVREGALAESLTPRIQHVATILSGLLGEHLGLAWSSRELMELLAGDLPSIGSLPPWALPAAGAVLVLGAAWPRRRTGKSCSETEEDDEEGESEVAQEYPMGKALKREIKGLLKKGEVNKAAELAISQGFSAQAAELFIQAGNHARAAEVRKLQGRTLEAAELFEKAECWEHAGKLLADEGEADRAAACYLSAGKKGSAAELFEKAGNFKKAGDCYRDAEYFRHAAHSYVQCKDWARAAECLEAVILDEAGAANAGDPQKKKAFHTLVMQAGKLYEQSCQLEKAREVLEKGKCYAAAAGIAESQGESEQAAELFLLAGQMKKAADAFKRAGKDKRSAQILGDYHRDRGEDQEAARCLEEAEDYFAAAELYRTAEAFDRAATCFEQSGDAVQAAEMFIMAGDRRRAAQNYEYAGNFAEAATCYAEAGDPEREIELLERAGEYLRVGEALRQRNMTEDAIQVLQKIESDHPDYLQAAAFLGELFRLKGKIPFAIKKLEQAIGDEAICAETVSVHYSLALAYEEEARFEEAVTAFERILTHDYQYGDAELHLETCREEIRQAAPVADKVGLVPAAEGRYQIQNELGRGGMGIVHKAQDSVLDRTVAYKVLPHELRENPKVLKNFLREAKSAAQLNHPNIVTVYDAGEQDGRFYIAMEYVEGTTLKEILRARGVISSAGVVHVLLQVCEALAYAHEKKIVHRDIKPANIMWTSEKQAKIMDFGLAKVIEEVRNHTTVVAGTPYYMSPEQTLGRDVDHRTDIYSLGVTLFELATGQLPFREGNVPYHHVHTPIPDPRSINPKLPGPLVRIIARSLEKDPAARYQTVREILTELKAAIAKRK